MNAKFYTLIAFLLISASALGKCVSTNQSLGAVMPDRAKARYTNKVKTCGKITPQRQKDDAAAICARSYQTSRPKALDASSPSKGIYPCQWVKVPHKKRVAGSVAGRPATVLVDSVVATPVPTDAFADELGDTVKVKTSVAPDNLGDDQLEDDSGNLPS